MSLEPFPRETGFLMKQAEKLINTTSVVLNLWFQQLVNRVLTRPAGSSAFTQGSIPFADSDGDLTEDNDKLFFDDTNDKLGIGDVTPEGYLTVNQGAATTINISAKASFVAHGCTTIAETDSYMIANSESATLGGGEITGLAEEGGVGFRINGYTSVSPT